MPRLRWLIPIAIGIALLRTELPIRMIRLIDQRLALFAPRGARAYSIAAPPLLAGLYRAVVADLTALHADGARVVDIGSGPGSLLAELAEALPSARLTGIEPAGEMRQIAQERLVAAGLAGRVTVLEGSAEAIPVADGSADVVVSTLSAHHWTDPVAAFREIGRCLAPEGEARVYDVRFAAFSARELRRLAAAAGFDPGMVRREVLDVRIGPLRPFAVAVWPARRPAPIDTSVILAGSI
ncbi:MAG: class I SAM-dependent methyltransferase [Chloroflexota bacterium]|nr:class I SAM-dependent methyltransferase [Chloroflexota bacterium]